MTTECDIDYFHQRIIDAVNQGECAKWIIYGRKFQVTDRQYFRKACSTDTSGSFNVLLHRANKRSKNFRIESKNRQGSRPTYIIMTQFEEEQGDRFYSEEESSGSSSEEVTSKIFYNHFSNTPKPAEEVDITITSAEGVQRRFLFFLTGNRANFLGAWTQ